MIDADYVKFEAKDYNDNEYELEEGNSVDESVPDPPYYWIPGLHGSDKTK